MENNYHYRSDISMAESLSFLCLPTCFIGKATFTSSNKPGSTLLFTSDGGHKLALWFYRLSATMIVTGGLLAEIKSETCRMNNF